jgi:hypothetical protein
MKMVTSRVVALNFDLARPGTKRGPYDGLLRANRLQN